MTGTPLEFHTYPRASRGLNFALRRKTGYMSEYSLAMLYPSWECGRWFQGRAGEYVAPVFVRLGHSGRETRWVQVAPWLVRFPSWVARKVRGQNARGQVGEHSPMPWKARGVSSY